MRQFNAIKNAVNFGRGKTVEIQIGDKVKWVGFRGDTEVHFTATVENIGEFFGKKTFTVRKHGTFPEDRTQTQISASRVTKI